MAYFPQLDTVLEGCGKAPVTIRRISHTLSEYGSPVPQHRDWETQGLVGNVSAHDEQYFQGLLNVGEKKIYLRGDAVATSGIETKTVRQLRINLSDYIVLEGTEYMIVAIRDYDVSNGLYVVLVKVAGG